MAHFAEIDENNIVTRVLVVPNDQEDRGHDYLANDLGLGGTWLQCSYNGKIRRRYPGPGYTYDPVNDVFLEPKLYSSWVLNENFDWVAPVPYPDDTIPYVWNEDTLSWELVDI